MSIILARMVRSAARTWSSSSGALALITSSVTCATRVLEGEVEHRDFHLSDREQAHGLMLPCCSWARSPRLVLDL